MGGKNNGNNENKGKKLKRKKNKRKAKKKKNQKKNAKRKKNKQKNTKKKNKKQRKAKKTKKKQKKVKSKNDKQRKLKRKNDKPNEKGKNEKKARSKKKKIKTKQRRNKQKSKKNKEKQKKTKKKPRKGKGQKSPRPEGRIVCGETQVNETCLQNAVDALNFEKNQIQNFFKQKARLANHNKTTGNKLGKKGEFKDAAKYMLIAIGGNISNPTCGESGTANKARSAKSAVENFNTLLNCSATIKEACTMPKHVFNASKKAKLDERGVVFTKSKTAADDCRSNAAYTSNGTAACSCWFKAAIGIKIAKEKGCSASDTAKQVKAAKKKCTDAFMVCKKAEDAAVALIHTCMAGEVKNITSSGGETSAGPVPGGGSNNFCPQKIILDSCDIGCSVDGNNNINQVSDTDTCTVKSGQVT